MRPSSSRSVRRTLLFAWVAFLLLQQMQRLFLLPEALAREEPSFDVLVHTLTLGFRGDLMVATFGVLIALGLAFVVLLPGLLLRQRRRLFGRDSHYHRGLTVSLCVVAMLLLVLLTVDMGYYHYNQHHLDFVFFEYVDDLFVQTTELGVGSAQAAQQTGAEIQDSGKWGILLAGFYGTLLVVIGAWWVCFRRVVQPALAQWRTTSPIFANAILFVAFGAGAIGLHPKGPYAIRVADISSIEYYTLAQNPILYASEALRATLASRSEGEHIGQIAAMPLPEAVQRMQHLIDPDGEFPYARYPFVRATESVLPLFRESPPNLLIILVEALDRRFLNREVGRIPVTPFLDAFREDSLYFEHFFSNGVQTARGVFSSLCSYVPRQGHAAMKTRYAHDYVCLPSVLRRHGYRTEMVISEHRDLNRLQLFVSRNGLQQLFDETDYPPEIQRIGFGPSLGMPDGALLDLVRQRLDVLQRQGTPFFLTTLTLGTHHPFTVPDTNPTIQKLQQDPDGFVAAVHYLDQEFAKFFAASREAGLLRNTVVLILGDHGRHEVIGQTVEEKQIGHFFAPLFLWVDPSLRTSQNYHPRVISSVASQVDLMPTLLGLSGLTPRMAPFLGRDLSCLLVQDCGQDNIAFLSSVYDNLIALADQKGLLVYSLRTENLWETDLDLHAPSTPLALDDPRVADRYRNLLAFYVGANVVLDRNAIWSWTELGSQL